MDISRPDLSNTIECLIFLHQNLHDVQQRELNWLYNNTIKISADHYEAGLRTEIEDRLHNASAGLSILYLFAIFETYFPRFLPSDKKRTDDRWKHNLAPRRLQTLLAYRHIRHTVAHGFNGHRADNNRQHFDEEMKANPIQGVACYDNDSIWLSHAAGLNCVDFMQRVAQHATASIADGKIVDWDG